MKKNSDRMSIEDFLAAGHSFDRKSQKKTRPEIKSKKTKMNSSEFKSETEKSQKRSKFGAQITYVDGIMFHSKWESKRYSTLKIMEKSKLIKDLRLQVPYEIIVNDILITKYVADFVYIENGKEVIRMQKDLLLLNIHLRKN